MHPIFRTFHGHNVLRFVANIQLFAEILTAECEL